MDISFTIHARGQMKERAISEAEILETLRSPIKTITQDESRQRAVGRIQRNGKEYLLVVVYRLEDKNPVVITMFLTSKIDKYL